MGYILDLTIVLEIIFWLRPQNNSLSDDDIDEAFSLYAGLNEQVQVHRDIRSYVDNVTDHKDAHVEVKRLITAHRRNSTSKFEGISPFMQAPEDEAPPPFQRRIVETPPRPKQKKWSWNCFC
jgi:hypothetical protein